MAKPAEDKRLVQVEKSYAPIVEKAEALKIVDEQSMAEATELLSKANKGLDLITEEKEKITKPLNEALKAERARWKPMETVLESAVSILRKGITAYQTEAKRKADLEAAKLAERVGEGRGKLKAETAIRKMGEIEGPQAKVETASGSLKFRTEKKFEVVDMSKLPVEYLLPDEPAIRKAMKEGIELPGVRYYTEEVPINSR